ncbi:hypothetical protein QQG74_09380 [Micromonospora sp. FIMYZ51]|uniref:hypothetical protein n=1 Tax=Micromonospora sp. FIMYZ51 TaxID=3051832 RepID=UPI00311F790B
MTRQIDTYTDDDGNEICEGCNEPVEDCVCTCDTCGDTLDDCTCNDGTEEA